MSTTDDIASTDIRQARTALAILRAPREQLRDDTTGTFERNAEVIATFLDRIEGQRTAERRQRGDFTPELDDLKAQAKELRVLSSVLEALAVNLAGHMVCMRRNGHDASDALQVIAYADQVNEILAKLTAARDKLGALGTAFGEPAA